MVSYWQSIQLEYLCGLEKLSMTDNVPFDLDFWATVKIDTTIGFFKWSFLFVANTFGKPVWSHKSFYRSIKLLLDMIYCYVTYHRYTIDKPEP